jgi:hypothetical protein
MTYCCDLSGVEHLNLKKCKAVTNRRDGLCHRRTSHADDLRMIFEGLWAEGTNHRKENGDDLL